MKIILLSVLLSSTSIFSQITITNNDFANMFTVGNEITIRENDTGGGVNIGNPGGGNNWDFSWFQGSLKLEMMCINPATSPYINEFPDANVATYSVGDFEGDQAELWQYSSLNSSLNNHGSAVLLESQPGDLFTIKHKPARIEAELPLTINSSWSQSYTQTLYFNGNPILTSQISYSVVVDAYGTMTLPGQVSFEALRMRQTITVDGIITGVNYQFLSKSGAQVSVFASDPNPPNSGVIIVDGYSWNFEFETINLSLTVDHPGLNDIVIAGEPDSIIYLNWNGEVDLYLSVDNGENFEIIDSNYNSPVGIYYWDVPESLLTTRAIVSVVDSKDSALSRNFKIKPWQLTRLTFSNNFELFQPDFDGWSFSNSTANIWPQSWWQQFDYQSGIDPYTNILYPPLPPFSLTSGSIFPDWPLFVDVFGISKCYMQTLVGLVYRPKALTKWNRINRQWAGSCAGFAVSSLHGFYFWKSLIPFIGNFGDQLFTVPLSDASRYVINYYQVHQSGKEARKYRRENMSTTPRELLGDLKEMLSKENGDGRPLDFYNPSGSGGHAVVPYKLERIGNTSTFNVIVYDSNAPASTSQTITLDSLQNQWNENTGFNWSLGTSGCFLERESEDFLSIPSLSKINSLGSSEQDKNGSSRLLFYNTHNSEIIITSVKGEQIGYQDSISFNNITDAVPIIPLIGGFHPPIGYDLPMDNYSIQINNFTTPDSYIMFETDSTIYDYRRIDADNNETDLLNYSENGIKIINPDQAEKNIELETIIIEDTTSEKLFIVSNLNLSEGDSLQIKEEGRSDLVLSNYGSGKNYDLHIRLASTNGEMLFEHNAISIDKNTGHQLVPDWNDLENQPVKILIDFGNDGTIDDSIFVKNQSTDIKNEYISGSPVDFNLYQNYPNPFNPATTITFDLPKQELVVLKIYNILGQEVAVLINEVKQAGRYQEIFEASDLPSGVYIYKLTAGEFRSSKKMLFVK